MEEVPWAFVVEVKEGLNRRWRGTEAPGGGGGAEDGKRGRRDEKEEEGPEPHVF